MAIPKHLTNWLSRSRKKESNKSISESINLVRASIEGYENALKSHEEVGKARDEWGNALKSNAALLQDPKSANRLGHVVEATKRVDIAFNSSQEAVSEAEKGIIESMNVFEKSAVNEDDTLNGLNVMEAGDDFKEYIHLRPDGLARARVKQILPSSFKFAQCDVSSDSTRDVLSEIFAPSKDPIYITKDGLVIDGVTQAMYSSLFKSVDVQPVRVLPYSSVDVSNVLALCSEICSNQDLYYVADEVKNLSVKAMSDIYIDFVKGGKTSESFRKACSSKGVIVTSGRVAARLPRVTPNPVTETPTTKETETSGGE